MPNKEWLHIKLYITFILSICYVFGQLVLSHFTHALTLQFSAYHMLCNIVALTGRMLTIKKNDPPITRQIDDNILNGHITGTQTQETDNEKPSINDEKCEFMKFTRTIAVPLTKRNHIEQKLRNTFGWVRIDCLFISVCFIFLASFSSVHATEVIKKFLHMDHKHTAHFPELVLLCGVVGIMLNVLTSLLIGGYTIQQGSFLHIKSTGDVILNQNVAGNNKISNENMKISKINIELTNIDNSIVQSYERDLNTANYNKIHENVLNIFRDISSIIFVLICASIIYIMDSSVEFTKYVDPVISLISCFVLISIHFPYMYESCLVLLQAIPGSIDIENFQNKLLSTFHEIVKLHDFHIWSLTANKYVSTVHIIFKNPESYLKIMSDVEQFFRDQGITLVTIQPEFEKQSLRLMRKECLISCNSLECVEKTCCQPKIDLKEVSLVTNLTGISMQIDEYPKIKKHFHIISVKNLQEINSISKSISYLNNENSNNNNSNSEHNIKNFSSDSQISSTASTTSTNISETFEPDTRSEQL